MEVGGARDEEVQQEEQQEVIIGPGSPDTAPPRSLEGLDTPWVQTSQNPAISGKTYDLRNLVMKLIYSIILEQPQTS